MAYYIRKGLVEENQELFDKILRVVVHGGETLQFPCRSSVEVPKYRNQLNRLLRATRDLPDECGGRFVGLRYQVVVSDDLKTPAVLMKPKLEVPGLATRAVLHMSNEHDMLALLANSHEESIPLDFRPSPKYEGDDWFTDMIAKLGYNLSIIEFTEDDGPLAGTKSYVATRIRSSEQRGAFGILDRYTKPGGTARS